MSGPEIAFSEQVLIAWTRHWGIHQLCPFVNVLLSITGGAIDNWPLHGALNWWHWHVRLPLVLLAMVWPSSVLSFLAHVFNLGFLMCTMPFVWDHMMWASLPEIALVASMLTNRFVNVAPDFLAAARTQAIISYCCAAFWKCNTAFLDPAVSCGTLLVAELLSIMPHQIVAPHGFLAKQMLRAAPLITIIGEFSIPLALFFSPSGGVLLGLGFHLTILMLPVNAAGGFSIACATSYFAFVPRGQVLVWEMLTKSFGVGAFFVAVIGVIFATLRGTQDATFAIFLVFAVLLILGIALEVLRPVVKRKTPPLCLKLQIGLAFISLSHGLLGPILGVQQMASLTMYGNLQHWGGSNHLLVPTSILQNVFTDASLETFLGGFAGGNVRVDSTDLPVDLLRSPADASKLLPVRVQEFLKGVGNAGLFYVPYYARMAANDFFDDVKDSSGPAMNWQRQPFAIPVFELRRLLVLARKRGEPFSLRYTVLPNELDNPVKWGKHTGPQVSLEMNSAGSDMSCTIDGDQPCSARELEKLSPPPSWLSFFLLQYPVPLTGSNDAELLCVV